mmetsp:Transcript_8193/g.24379  ORF Transcript_8193/g.24379 Transcript_8193/m.24379 type:complete len:433 (+) Transcript_8193:5743-7041(+)
MAIFSLTLEARRSRARLFFFALRSCSLAAESQSDSVTGESSRLILSGAFWNDSFMRATTVSRHSGSAHFCRTPLAIASLCAADRLRTTLVPGRRNLVVGRMPSRPKLASHRSFAESGIFPAATRARLWISVFSLSSANLSLPDSTAFISRARISSGVQTLLRVVLLWTPDLFWGFGISSPNLRPSSIRLGRQRTLSFTSLRFIALPVAAAMFARHSSLCFFPLFQAIRPFAAADCFMRVASAFSSRCNHFLGIPLTSFGAPRPLFHGALDELDLPMRFRRSFSRRLSWPPSCQPTCISDSSAAEMPSGGGIPFQASVMGLNEELPAVAVSDESVAPGLLSSVGDKEAAVSPESVGDEAPLHGGEAAAALLLSSAAGLGALALLTASSEPNTAVAAAMVESCKPSAAVKPPLAPSRPLLPPALVPLPPPSLLL